MNPKKLGKLVEESTCHHQSCLVISKLNHILATSVFQGIYCWNATNEIPSSDQQLRPIQSQMMVSRSPDVFSIKQNKQIIMEASCQVVILWAETMGRDTIH